MVSSEIAAQFMATNWLLEMDSEARQAVLAELVEHHSKPGTILLDRNKPNDCVGFLMEGTLEITRPNARNKEDVLIEIEAPSLFGLTTFFRNTAPDFTARAKTRVTYLTLDRAAHQRLRREDPVAAEQLAMAAVHVLSDRLAALNQRITEDLRDHVEDDARHTEWSNFRARLFDENIL